MREPTLSISTKHLGAMLGFRAQLRSNGKVVAECCHAHPYAGDQRVLHQMPDNALQCAYQMKAEYWEQYFRNTEEFAA